MKTRCDAPPDSTQTCDSDWNIVEVAECAVRQCQAALRNGGTSEIVNSR